ncbi:MAG: hypothetical protein ACETWM_16755 [Candidatus Lokiarchaeia archaeon]
MTLTSRERVIMAVNHEEPDRVPIEFGGLASSIYAKQNYWPIEPRYGYRALVKYLGYTDLPQPVIHVGNCVQNFHPKILDRFGVDIITYFMPVRMDNIVFNSDGTVTVNWGFRSKMVGYYWEIIDGPLTSKRELTFKDVDTVPFPDPEMVSPMEVVKRQVKELRESTERAIIAYPSMFENIFHTYS